MIDSKVYKSLTELALAIRHRIDSYDKKVPLPGTEVILSWASLVASVGDIFDTIENRKRALAKGGFSKTMYNVLREGRVDILRKALKEYNPELYIDL